eukprot:1996818-Lingulodinium_polyedra.AAC.1
MVLVGCTRASLHLPLPCLGVGADLLSCPALGLALQLIPAAGSAHSMPHGPFCPQPYLASALPDGERH